MKLTLTLDIPPLPKPILYTDRVMLVGSCFTEHIADRLAQHKFKVLSNPHGILFNPHSVAGSISGYIDGRVYKEDELFYLNELWNSWEHHTRFSDIDKGLALNNINQAQRDAAAFIRQADHVIITLGSAFQYYVKETGKPVANNHRAPAQWFEKRLLPIAEIISSMGETLQKLLAANPQVQVLFTISPVRHIRDGVTDNNRSKARLIEAVHELCANFKNTYYFPAYELVMDILRDYRYYDIDFVHPNYLATTYVWEEFVKACIGMETQAVMAAVQEIITARNHRTRFPQTEAHRKFMSAYLDKVKAVMAQQPYIDLTDELKYFSE